jgi:RiboL-PSP-HEPN
VATSKRWRDLRRDIAALRAHFLPDPFDPLGVYPDQVRVQAFARAFIVLCHAEVESYLEGWAKDIARKSETVWTVSNKVTMPLAFLISTVAQKIQLPTTLAGTNPKDSPQKLQEATAQMFQTFYKLLKDNHGIKEGNLLALFAPLGLPASATGATLLPNLDAFGALRGTLAHQSGRAIVNALDPETEHKRVVDLVSDLADLDAWLVVCRRNIR